MKTKLVILLTLSVGVLGKLAVAQNSGTDLQGAQAQYAVYHPDQSNAAMQLTAWDRDRCDGDHDRDDRGCRWRDRDDWRWRNGYVARPNIYGGSFAGRRGVYDRSGDFHPAGSNGYYDRNGYWHHGGGWWR